MRLAPIRIVSGIFCGAKTSALVASRGGRMEEELAASGAELVRLNAAGDASVIAAPIGQGMNLKPGTLLVREYKNEMHRVTVMAEGYAWHGQTYRTLSAVARAITGANWNGYVFFGLKKKAEVTETSESGEIHNG